MYTDESNVLTVRQTPECRANMYASSIIGTRKYQQDSYACIDTSDGALAVVCDGMGGLEGGERASSLATGTLLDDFIKNRIVNCIQFFYEEAAKLDKMVYQISDTSGKPLGAGTTIVAVRIKDNRLNWLSVGDSKIYLIRNDTMQCIVREHNYRATLNELLNSGKITLEKYHSEEAKAEALTSFIGIGNVSLIDINETEFELIEGDILLLCSDGLYKSLTETQILAIIKDNYFDCQRAADTLTSSALEFSRRGQDNTTVVIVKYA